MSDKDNPKPSLPAESDPPPGTMPPRPARAIEGQDSHETFSDRLKRRRQEAGTFSSSSQVDSSASRPTGRPFSKERVMMILESPHPAASVARKDGRAARSVEGVSAILFANDFADNDHCLGAAFPEEPLLAEGEVSYKGQPVALIVGQDETVCREARDQIKIDYHTAPGILTVEHAMAMKSFHRELRKTGRGNVESAIPAAANLYEGTLTIGSQSPCLTAVPQLSVFLENEGRSIRIQTTSLLPTGIRSAVARAAGIPECAVDLDAEAISGITGGLDLEMVRLTVLATRAALKSNSSIRVVLDSLQSPLISGQRHFVLGKFQVGYEDNGVITAANISLYFDGGYFIGDSTSILERALLHTDSVYGIPNFRARGILCKTNNVTSSSMPAEGASQGAWIMEEIIQRVASGAGRPIHEIRERNFYNETSGLKTAPCGQPVDCAAIQRVWKHAIGRSAYHERLQDVEDWNRDHFSYKRGIAVTPMKFGLGDPRPERNMAMTHIQIFPDGSVQVRLGQINLNDGLDLQIKEEISLRLGVRQESIRVVFGDFDATPQATPVLGVDSAGLALRSVEDACNQLIQRLREVALQLFAARGQTEVEAERIQFFEQKVGFESSQIAHLNFTDVVGSAWKKRTNLLAIGYHRTPNLWWDPELGAGWPFSSFTYAAAVTEVQVDAFTGEVQILRTDIAHEGSSSPEQAKRDEAQLFRSFNLGIGWVLSEEISRQDEEGKTPDSTCRGIPGFADEPSQWNSDRLRPMGDPLSAAGDPCGQAPVLLAFSIREALWDALRAFGFEADLVIDLSLPATPQNLLATCREISRQLAERAKEPNAKSADDRDGKKQAG